MALSTLGILGAVCPNTSSPMNFSHSEAEPKSHVYSQVPNRKSTSTTAKPLSELSSTSLNTPRNMSCTKVPGFTPGVMSSLMSLKLVFPASTGESLTGSTVKWAVVESTLNGPVIRSVCVSTPVVPEASPLVKSQSLKVKDVSPLKFMCGKNLTRLAPRGWLAKTTALFSFEKAEMLTQVLPPSTENCQTPFAESTPVIAMPMSSLDG